MGKQQLKLLLIAASSLAMLVTSMFVLPWFITSIMGASIEFDLRSASVCAPTGECASVSLSHYGGGYATSGAAAFWLGLIVVVLVVLQTASRLVTGAANDRLTRIGYLVACGAALAGFCVAFIFAPDAGGAQHVDAGLGITIDIERSWAPLAFIVGNLVALLTFYQSIVEWTSDDAEYKPIKIDKDRLPVTPLSNNRVPLPPGHQSGRIPKPSEQSGRLTPITPNQQSQPGRVALPDSLPLEGGRPGAPTDVGASSEARARRASTSPPIGGEEVRVRIGSGSSAPLGADGRPRSPSQAPLGADGRPRSPSQAPLGADGRPRSPSQAPLGAEPRTRTATLGSDARARTPSQGATAGNDGRSRMPSQAPIDVRARIEASATIALDERAHFAPDADRRGIDSHDAQSPSEAPNPELRGRLDSGATVALDERTATQYVRARTPSQTDARTSSESPVEELRVRIDSGASIALDERTAAQYGADTRPRTPSQAPLAADPRARTPSQAPLNADPRARTPSQAPYPRATSPSPAAIEVDSRPNSPAAPYGGRAPSPSQGVPFGGRTPSPAHGVPFGGRTPSPAHGVPFGGRTPSPAHGVPFGGRTPSPSQGVPLAAHTSSPVDPVQRARSSSSGPIDMAARLGAASPVAIRPPLPTAEPVPPDQIPVDPAAGLTIRKRTPSSAPLPDSAFAPPISIPIAPESGLVIRKKSPTAAPPTGRVPTAAMPAVAVEGIEGLDELKKELSRPIAIPQPDPELPAPLRGKLRFAVVNVELASTGIRARREDGTDIIIDWDKIVGLIARRLPPDAPYASATMVDILSTAGSTLRVLPWTRIVGGLPLSDSPVERARELVNVISAQALGAKLDPATKLFADGNGQAAQLPTVALLGTHDARIS